MSLHLLSSSMFLENGCGSRKWKYRISHCHHWHLSFARVCSCLITWSIKYYRLVSQNYICCPVNVICELLHGKLKILTAMSREFCLCVPPGAFCVDLLDTKAWCLGRLWGPLSRSYFEGGFSLIYVHAIDCLSFLKQLSVALTKVDEANVDNYSFVKSYI